jgi:serine/threonine protein kinase
LSVKKSSFRDAALLSGLVTQDQIEEAMLRVKEKSPGASSAGDFSERELAAMMVSLNHLTAYQADKLLEGRTKFALGPYIITDWIGQGGMGQVFKAVHEMLGRESAVKVLPKFKASPEAIENFRREIRTQAKLDHPNLVRAFDAGIDGDVHYLVVEYVDGTDLRKLVRTKGMISVQQAANIIKQAAEGLEYAHQRGLIHRDIKPGNILVTSAGVAKVSDLGLAGHLSDTAGRSTKIVGTADYLAPEQIRSPLDVTKVADIYALGCTLYYAITGKVPFPGGNTKSKARRHLEETPWHPRRFNPEVSNEFVDLIGDMMEKDPRQRIQSAAEVAERLTPWTSEQNAFPEIDNVRSRWAVRGHSPEGQQDTDPGATRDSDVEMSDDSGGGSGSMAGSSSSISDSAVSRNIPTAASQLPVAPPPVSVVEQFTRAKRVQKSEFRVPLTWAVVMAMAGVALGTLLGLAIAWSSHS